MFGPASSKSSSAVPGDTSTGSGREFGRLGARLQPDKVGLAIAAQSDPDAALDSDVTPIDYSAKAFIGPNATYYDDRWRWMDWSGRWRSWNWAAAASFGIWLAYRRMHRYAACAVLWLGLLVALAASGTPLHELAIAHLLVALGLGLYGNTLYHLHFRRVARKVARGHREHAERVAALNEAGGVDRRAVFIMVGVIGVVVAAAVAGVALTGTEPRLTL